MHAYKVRLFALQAGKIRMLPQTGMMFAVGLPVILTVIVKCTGLKMLCALAVASNPLAAAFDEMIYFLWIDQYYKREQIEVEASVLYPEIEVVSVEQYMTDMIKAAA